MTFALLAALDRLAAAHNRRNPRHQLRSATEILAGQQPQPWWVGR